MHSQNSLPLLKSWFMVDGIKEKLVRLLLPWRSMKQLNEVIHAEVVKAEETKHRIEKLTATLNGEDKWFLCRKKEKEDGME